jgi:hypothetical protein
MAAGLGFKTFTTGEVLTAADVNGYLMQGVLVFASAAARNAAITSPQEGQFAFTKDTNGLWYYDGAAWVASGATGDIEGVTAGVGITGGGTSGTVTITNDMATTITAAGDIVIGTGSGTYDNLPIGTTAQVLTADTTVSPYKVKWAAPAGGGTWTSYTPTLTNLTLGNGTLTSFYNNDGKTVNYVWYIKWGSTTSAGGNFTISTPVAADTSLGNAGVGYQANGSGIAFDDSSSAVYISQVMLTGSTTARLQANDTASFANYVVQRPVGTTSPMTWATNDVQIGFITYKAA